MITLVKLKISKKATSKIIKEVADLSEINTPNPDEVVVKKDATDNKLLWIYFESFKGKQVDLVDGIMNSYSDFLDCYSDISVQFSTKRNPIDWPD